MWSMVMQTAVEPEPVSENGNPPVSVFVSVFNGEDYIVEAVESVLEQTEQDFELVVIDDGSEDRTVELLQQMDDPRIRVFSKPNEGIGAPLNPWLRQCRGKYIMRIDADDVCAPGRMRAQVDFLEANPDVVIVGGQFRHFVDDTIGTPSSLPLSHREILDGLRQGIHTISHATTMWRASLLEQMDGYQWSGAGEDWSLLLEAVRYGELANLSEVVYHVRLHSESSSARGARSVIEGFAFARARYERFLDGDPHYSLQEHDSEVGNSWLDEVSVQARALSLSIHRRSHVKRFAGRSVEGAALLVAAAVLDPRKTAGALWKVWRRSSSHLR